MTLCMWLSGGESQAGAEAPVNRELVINAEIATGTHRLSVYHGTLSA